VSRIGDSLLPAFLAAVAVHAAALGWIASRPDGRTLRRLAGPTQVRLVARAPAPEPPRPAPVPEPPRRASVVPSGRTARPPPEAARAAPAPAPTPRAEPPAPTPPPQPRRFAVSMDAVVPGGAGGVAVPTTEGRTAARGDPRLPASTPAGDNTAYAAAPADVTEVERAPVLLRQPSIAETRALYPEAARRDGVEADVGLELLVSERGEVGDVRVVRPAGQGFDEVARQLGARMRFRPAERGGRAVAVWIPWTWKFRLEG
jgi:TonB family protein